MMIRYPQSVKYHLEDNLASPRTLSLRAAMYLCIRLVRGKEGTTYRYANENAPAAQLQSVSGLITPLSGFL